MWTGLRDDPDIRRLTDVEFRNWVYILDVVAERETDGIFFAAGKQPAWFRGLVAKGRLVQMEEPEVYFVKGWDNRQKSKAELDELREKRRHAGSMGGSRKAANRLASARANGAANANQSLEVREVPTSATRKGSRKRGPSVEAQGCANHLKARLQQRGAFVGMPKDWHLEAAGVADAMIATGATPEQVTACIDWALDDRYWSTRLTTMHKVRDVFPRFLQEHKSSTAGALPRAEDVL